MMLDSWGWLASKFLSHQPNRWRGDCKLGDRASITALAQLFNGVSTWETNPFKYIPALAPVNTFNEKVLGESLWVRKSVLNIGAWKRLMAQDGASMIVILLKTASDHVRRNSLFKLSLSRAIGRF